MAHERIKRDKGIRIRISLEEMPHAPAILQSMGMPAALANVFLTPEVQTLQQLALIRQQEFLTSSMHQQQVMQLQHAQLALKYVLMGDTDLPVPLAWIRRGRRSAFEASPVGRPRCHHSFSGNREHAVPCPETQLRCAVAMEKLQGLGYKIVPLVPNTKVPLVKGWQNMDQQELRRIVEERPCNVAVVLTDGLLVVDVDSEDGFLEKHRITSPMQIKTPHGRHLWLRYELKGLTNMIKPLGIQIDFRVNGHTMIPESVIDELKYEWDGEILPIGKLPVFSSNILASLQVTRRALQRTITGGGDWFKRAMGYAARVEGAVSGQNGHNRTIRLAVKLTRKPPEGFGLRFGEALAVMLVWNEQCQPKWTLKELEWKINSALKVS